MFQVGDRIVYPMHGAGIVEAIENKEVQGTIKSYYIIKLSINQMQVMVPVGNEEIVGVRHVIDNTKLKSVYQVFVNGETNEDLTCKERLKLNAEKIKTGDFREEAEVIRDLFRMNEIKPLNASEKKMLNKAKELLQSELVMIQDITDSEIKSFLNPAL